MSIATSISELVRRWRSQGVEILLRANEHDVARAFESVDSRASGEVVELFGLLGGMSKMDNEYWRMWSLQEIIEANQAKSAAGVLFSDLLMDCHQYRLKPIDEYVSEVWIEGFDYGPPVRISKSLTEFFSAYLSHPDSVLSTPPSRSQYDPGNA